MSFIKVDSNSDFSYQNLPYGVFSTEENVSLNLKLKKYYFAITLSLFFLIEYF